MCVVIFFFFQAEDGIRDYKVTGVQTCALPILKASRKDVAHAGSLAPATAPGAGAHRSTLLGLLRPECPGLQRRYRGLEPGDDFSRERLAHELLDVPHEQPFVG